MCSKCNLCISSERINPEEELWVLCKQAFQKYQVEIINDDKLYHRYVNDFISFNLPIASNDINDWQYHSMNLSRMYELLTMRHDLVEKYFVCSEYTKDNFEQMIREFNTDKCYSLSNKEILGDFSDEQLNFIKEVVNKAHLFTSEVSLDDMKNFFTCSLILPLEVSKKSLGKLAMLLDRLRDTGLLSHNWQTLIQNNKLLVYGTPLHDVKYTNISSALSEYRKRHYMAFADISNEILKLAYSSLDNPEK